MGGRARIPGRFAIDWFRVDQRGRIGVRTRADAAGGGSSGQTAAARPDRPSEFFGYGAEGLAVADEVVAAARDGVAEPERASAAPRVPAAAAAGNFVALAVGGGRYALYEHRRPGLRVRVGQRVRRGQVIGDSRATGSCRVSSRVRDPGPYPALDDV